MTFIEAIYKQKTLRRLEHAYNRSLDAHMSGSDR